MTVVKVCGITGRKEALEISKLGVNVMGFVFSNSPRRLSVEKAKEISKALPPFIFRVGVFVDEPVERVLETVNKVRLQAVQLHGRETPEFCKKMTVSAVKAIKVSKKGFFPDPLSYRGAVSAYILDTYLPEKSGGTGKKFNWKVINDFPEVDKPVIIAGGLNPENVGELVKKYSPYGVDVSSGVESSPGKKSIGKVKEFLEQVKKAEKAISKQ